MSRVERVNILSTAGDTRPQGVRTYIEVITINALFFNKKLDSDTNMVYYSLRSNVRGIGMINKGQIFKTVKNRMHKDFTGEYGILINRNGATIIVDENSITDSELERLYKRYR